MKRFWSILLIATLLCLSLAGCFQQRPAEPTQPPVSVDPALDGTEYRFSPLLWGSVCRAVYEKGFLRSEEYVGLYEEELYVVELLYTYDDTGRLTGLVACVETTEQWPEANAAEAYSFRVSGDGAYASAEDPDMTLEISFYSSGMLRSLCLPDWDWSREQDGQGRVTSDSFDGETMTYTYSSDTDRYAVGAVMQEGGEQAPMTFEYGPRGLISATLVLEDAVGKWSWELAEDGRIDSFRLLADYIEWVEEYEIFLSYEEDDMQIRSSIYREYEEGEMIEEIVNSFEYFFGEDGSLRLRITRVCSNHPHFFTVEIKNEAGEYEYIEQRHDKCFEMERMLYRINENGSWENMTPEEETIEVEEDNGKKIYMFLDGELMAMIVLTPRATDQQGNYTDYDRAYYWQTANQGCFDDIPEREEHCQATYDDQSRVVFARGENTDGGMWESTLQYGSDGALIREETLSYLEGELDSKTEILYGDLVEDGEALSITIITYYADGEVTGSLRIRETAGGDEITYYDKDGNELEPVYPPIIILPPQ